MTLGIYWRSADSTDLSYETVRRRVAKFGPLHAGRLRRQRHRPDDRWQLDEMCVSICGRRMHLWRAVDAEGEALDIPLQCPNRRPLAAVSYSAAARANRPPLRADDEVPAAALPSPTRGRPATRLNIGGTK